MKITIVPNQLTFDASDGEPILNAARRAGIALPKSCRNGTCRTCICLLRAGAIHYRIEWPGLTREEKAAGYILPCVAHADGDLVIEAPEARRIDPPNIKSGTDTAGR